MGYIIHQVCHKVKKTHRINQFPERSGESTQHLSDRYVKPGIELRHTRLHCL